MLAVILCVNTLRNTDIGRTTINLDECNVIINEKSFPTSQPLGGFLLDDLDGVEKIQFPEDMNFIMSPQSRVL